MPMLILGIESATAQVGCAIGGHEGVLASAHSSRARRHAETLAPQIDFVRRQARIEMRDISVVAVDVGPGLYTGLRVGLATALSTAYGLGVPMIGVSSLDLLAFPARYTSKSIVVAIDARRGEVFTATYRQVPGGVQRMNEYQVTKPEELAAEIQASGKESSLLVGDGALRYRDVFAEVQGVDFADQALAYPRADALVSLAHARAMREEFVQPHELEPQYLRRPDAEINWKTRSNDGSGGGS